MPAVISLSGNWDIFDFDELRRRLTAAHTAERCILDFSGFRCGDATFLNELVYMGKVRRAQGRPPAVFVISPAETMVKKILELTHLASIWPIFESMDAAVAAIETRTIV